MKLNVNDVEKELVTATQQRLYKRKQKRVKINQGRFVQLIFNQSQACYRCKAKIFDDSFDGCGLLVKSEQKIYKGQKLLILMENIEPIKAEVMWSRRLNNTKFRIGVKYLGSKTLKMKLFFQKTNPDDC